MLPILFASNATGWNQSNSTLIPGGMIDRYIRPICDSLPPNSWVVDRQPHRKALNVYLATRGRYNTGHREIGVTGVMISHGIADKEYRNAVKSRSFAHVVAPGPLFADRLAETGVPRTKIHVLGYPKLDPVFNGQIPMPSRDSRIRVVWAPTHGGGGERLMGRQGPNTCPGAGATTWWRSDEFLPLLDPDRFDVVHAPHPRHRPDRKATLDEYVGADVVIADGGSTIYEAWALGLPVVFPHWITKDRILTRGSGETLEARIYRRRLGWHADSPAELVDMLAAAPHEGQGEGVAEFIDGILPPEFRGCSGKLHAEFLLSLAESGGRRRA